MTRFMPSANVALLLGLEHERLEKNFRIPCVAAQHGPAAGGAGAGGHGRKALARLRAQIPPDAWRHGLHHRPVRRAANAARRRLCLPRRLADGPVGPTPIADAVQRPFPGRLRLVLLWHHWLALLLGSFLFLAWSALSLPTTFAVVATSLKGTGTRWASACNPWCAACR